MSRRSRRGSDRPQLTGGWRSLHGAVWLIGLAILILTNWIWPGILILIGISLVIEALLMQFAPHAFEDSDAVQPLVPAAQAPLPEPEQHPELLPSNCPKCGGPTDGSNVKWTGPQSANCPYCGTNLPMTGR